MTSRTQPGSLVERVARRLTIAGVVVVGAVGIYAFAAPFGPSEPAYGATIPARALGCGLIGVAAGVLAALAAVDPERTGSGLFLALAGVAASGVALSIAFPAFRYLPLTTITIYAAPFALGYLIAAAIGEVTPEGTPGAG